MHVLPEIKNTILDYIKLGKTRMWLAIGLTILPGLLLGEKLPSLRLAAATIGGTVLVAISSFVFNQIWETEKDSSMHRTQNRPLPTGRLSQSHVVLYGFTLLVAGMTILYFFSGYLAALLALGSFGIYVFLYTILLKPLSSLNTIVGGFSGAVGPLIGEAAVSEQISLEGWLLFALLFIWQPPHFWTLAIRYKDDYARARICMLPVVYDLKRVYIHILVYQLILTLVFLVLPIISDTFSLYFFSIPSAVLSLVVMFMMFGLYQRLEKNDTMLVFYLTIFHMIFWHTLMCLNLIYFK